MGDPRLSNTSTTRTTSYDLEVDGELVARIVKDRRRGSVCWSATSETGRYYEAATRRELIARIVEGEIERM